MQQLRGGKPQQDPQCIGCQCIEPPQAEGSPGERGFPKWNQGLSLLAGTTIPPLMRGHRSPNRRTVGNERISPILTYPPRFWEPSGQVATMFQNILTSLARGIRWCVASAWLLYHRRSRRVRRNVALKVAWIKDWGERIPGFNVNMAPAHWHFAHWYEGMPAHLVETGLHRLHTIHIQAFRQVQCCIA